MNQSKLTFKQAAAALSRIGLNLSKLTDKGQLADDYRVAPKGLRKETEAQAYYTTDLDDAVSTGFVMAKSKERSHAA